MPAAKRKRPADEAPAPPAEDWDVEDGEAGDGSDDDLDADLDLGSDVASLDGASDDDAGEQHGRAKKSSEKDLFRVPTNAELKGFRDAALLYRSPLFQLQIEELLAQSKPDYAKLDGLETALRDIKALIDAPAEDLDMSLAEVGAWARKHKVAVPWTESRPADDVKYRFAFKAPAAVAVVGSFLLRHICRTAEASNVDLAVEMPAAIFQEKDFVNHRYYQKKAFYLAALAVHIRTQAAKAAKKAGKAGGASGTGPAFNPQITFACADGDRFKPVIVIRDSSLSKKFIVRLHPILPAAGFPAHALAPGRCNLRKEVAAVNTTVNNTQPTPHYNNGILADIFPVSHLNVLHLQRRSCPAFDAAAVLGRSWLIRRGFSGERGGFSGFVWSMLMDFVLRGGDARAGRVVGKNCSPYQLFRITLEMLAHRDLRTDPIFMTDDFAPLAGNAEFSKEAFLAAYNVVMVDPSGTVNLCARMDRGSLAELQLEARRTIALLAEDSTRDNFSDVFLPRTPSGGWTRYDEIFAAEVPTVSGQDPFAAADALDGLCRSIPGKLAEALATRTDAITVHRLRHSAEWELAAEWNSTNDSASQRLVIGCLLSEEQPGIVDHGPPSDDSEGAKRFKELWGELAELRRFKDGSIKYAVVWDVPKHPDGTAEAGWGWVLRRALPHLLKKHFGIASVSSFQAKLDSMLKYRHEPLQPDAFEEVSRRLRQLEELPLAVLNVARASTSSFGCDPAAHLLPLSARQPTAVIVEFVHSTKWPDDLEAIQKMKIALALEMADKFRRQFPGSAASVGGFGEEDRFADPRVARIASSSYLDIVTEKGAAFRCRLLVEHEKHLLETGIASPLTPAETKDALRRAKEIHSNLYDNAPYHALHLNNRCSEFRGLSWTIRLAKLWLASHLLSPHFPDGLIELLCLSVYTQPGSNAEPRSGSAGFLRFLDLLASWDWKNDALVVELHKGEMSPTVRAQVDAAFRTLRGSAANQARAAMFVATEMDTGSQHYSYEAPSFVVLDRARQLAKSALSAVVASVGLGLPEKLKGLFHASLKGYDALLFLDAKLAVAGRSETQEDTGPSNKRFKNLDLARKEAGVLRNAIDPVMSYCRDLRSTYKDAALFFADQYSGTCIGVVWNPHLVRKQGFRVSLPFSSRPDGLGEDGKPAVVPDKRAMVAEMLRLGGRLAMQASLAE